MNDPVENGRLSLCGTVVLGILSWLTPQNIDIGLKVITGLGALVSAILAGRYYWYATKEKKENLKRIKDGK